MSNHSIIDKIENLQSKNLLSNRDKALLFFGTYSLNSDIRITTAEVLALFPSDFSKKLLLKLVDDKNYLVRTNACDSISFCGDKNALLKLIKKLKDRHYLVRGYAALSLADVQINIGEPYTAALNNLQQILTVENDNWVKVCIYRSIIILGDKTVLEKYLSLYENGDYHVKRLFLSLLNDVMPNIDGKELYLFQNCLKNDKSNI